MPEFANGPFLLVILLLFVWLGAITFLLVRIFKTFTQLTKGVSEKDLKGVLDEVLATLKKGEKLTLDFEQRLERLKIDNKSNIQKVGLVRYNPFSGTGGNQSFALALLDGNNDGFVITSLHSRESTRVFAKPVAHGKESGYEFSKEEIQAILDAQKKGR